MERNGKGVTNKDMGRMGRFFEFNMFAHDSLVFLGLFCLGYFAQLLVLGGDGCFSERAW